MTINPMTGKLTSTLRPDLSIQIWTIKERNTFENSQISAENSEKILEIPENP